MDNMQVRKAQLQKLDDFVHTLYDECQVFAQYMNMKDLEILYLHIHELIQEMLQAKNTDEFMAMIEDLSKAVAGILIIAVPASGKDVMEDMKEAYSDFEGKDFEDFFKNLQKTSVQKYGGKSKVKGQQPEQAEEEVENDPEELIDMMDLSDYVTPKQKVKKSKKAPEKAKAEEPKVAEEKKTDEEDPFADLYDSFN